jgi:hypothetical protein
MAKRKRKNPFPFLSSFNEKQFEPFIRTIGQSTLLWNDLHEWLGHLYCNAIGGGLVNAHLKVWNAISNDRAKRDMLLAAAKATFVDLPINQTELQKKSYEAIKWLFDETNKLEEDRNNVIHAPLFRSLGSQEIYPASAFGNKRAMRLDDKHLLNEYQRIRDTAHLLRNYAASIHDPMNEPRLAWPNKPKLPDRGATKKPQVPPGTSVKKSSARASDHN